MMEREKDKERHDGNTLADVIKGRRRNFKELTPKEKVGYIIDYYWIPIVAGIFVAILVGTLGYHYIFENQDVLIYGVDVNVLEENETFAEDFEERYMEYADADPKEYQVTFETNLYRRGTDELGDEEIDVEVDYSTVMKLSTIIAANSLDFIICNDVIFESYELNASYYDLEELLPDDLYEELDAEGRIIFGQASNEETASRMDRYAMAIDITDTDFAKRDGLTPYSGDTLYFAVIVNTQQPEEAVNVVRYIFGYDYVPTEEPE